MPKTQVKKVKKCEKRETDISSSKIYMCKWLLPDAEKSCDFTSLTCTELLNHLEKSHLNSVDKPYLCNWQDCVKKGKSFDDVDSFMRHVRPHLRRRNREDKDKISTVTGPDGVNTSE